MQKQFWMLPGLAVVFAIVQLAVAAEKTVGGPFVIGVTGKTATVAWVVQNDEVTLRGPAASIAAPALQARTATLTSLQPNTRYDYSIESGGGMGSFKTPPAGLEPFRFFVYGDTRTRHDVHRRVMAEVLKHGIPDFILHTGDMVENGNDSAQWPIFFDIEKELLTKTAFFPALGNHERNSHYFEDIFHEGAPYYSFDWGNSHITVINSDIENSGPNPRARADFWAEELRWIEEDLQSHQKADYRFIVSHHPPFTAVASRQGNNAHITAMTSLLEKYKVSIAFFGHDHNYQHYLKNGIHYVTTGGGGAPLYDVKVPAEGITQKVVSIENFVEVQVNGKTVRMQAIGIDGAVLDEFTIEAR